MSSPRQVEVEADLDEALARIKALEAEVRRLRGLLQHEHEVLTDAVERSHNLLLFARDGGVNPS
jgi:hypothetical protein